MTLAYEPATWNCHLEVAKFLGDWHPEADPYDVFVTDYNMLLFGGVSCLWQALIGNGTSTAGQALTFFNTSQAAIGVGDSNTAAAATQTDLQASTNKLRVGMVASFPQHTDGVTAGASSITFRSTFDTTQANFAWEEAGVFNSVTSGTGRMLNRKVQSMGTKTSASSWQITFSISIS